MGVLPLRIEATRTYQRGVLPRMAAAAVGWRPMKRDRELVKAQKLLDRARTAILEAIAANDQLSMSEQYGGMELAQAADAVSDSKRRIDYSRRINGFGQVRS